MNPIEIILGIVLLLFAIAIIIVILLQEGRDKLGSPCLRTR